MLVLQKSPIRWAALAIAISLITACWPSPLVHLELNRTPYCDRDYILEVIDEDLFESRKAYVDGGKENGATAPWSSESVEEKVPLSDETYLRILTNTLYDDDKPIAKMRYISVWRNKPGILDGLTPPHKLDDCGDKASELRIAMMDYFMGIGVKYIDSADN